MPVQNVWTPQKTKVLQDLWPRPEHSASTIAAILGVSRNAVVGKIHRLRSEGFKMPVSGPRRGLHHLKKPAPAPKPVPAPKRAPLIAPDAPIPVVITPPPGAIRSPADLADHMCKWPIGDPRAPDFFFCAEPRLADKPYCAKHARKAYQGGGGNSDVERRQVFTEPVRLRRAAQPDAAAAGTSFAVPQVISWIVAGNHDRASAIRHFGPG
jgi:GcrA cell cycle regulator